MRPLFIHSPEAAQYEYGPDHPFDPRRAVRTYELCGRYGLLDPSRVEVARPAPLAEDALSAAHDRDYLAALRRASLGEHTVEMLGFGIGTPDCPVFRGLWEYAALAAGASVFGAERIASGASRIVFSPTGGFHHARRRKAEGFCYVNDVVLALLRLREAGLRPAFVDVDVHHSNGVQEAFYDDDRVLVATIHETGRTLYPFAGFQDEFGAGPGRGTTVNVPLLEGSDDEVYRIAFERIVLPALDLFRPDAIVVEAGLDAVAGDPLAHLRVSIDCLDRCIRDLRGLGLPILVVGGGGYNGPRTVRGWTLIWGTLSGIEPQDQFEGVVGGMMFGPEQHAGVLRDAPSIFDDDLKERARIDLDRVIRYLEAEVLPLIPEARGRWRSGPSS